MAGEQLDTLAMLPAALQPITRTGDRVEIHKITFLYRRLYQSLRRWARLRELNAPATVVSETHDMFVVDVAVLFDNDFARPLW